MAGRRRGAWEDPDLKAGLEAQLAVLGARLRELRTAAGLTAEGAAELAHMHPVTILELESGRQNPTIATLMMLARAYEVPITRLVGDVDLRF